MAFLSIIFSCPDSLYENIIAELSDSEIDSYFETESLIAYVEKNKWTDNLKAKLDALSSKYSMTYEVEELEDTNWNAVWEANFQAVSIGTFCHIRAEFHPKVTGFEHVIEISPKMAFGTGHHETTAMMIAQMSKLNFSNKAVLDYGCGTGILAVLADKLGARTIDALINRGVLLEQAKHLYKLLGDNGTLLISGILETDRALIEEKYLQAGFKIMGVQQDGDWLCFNLLKMVHLPS